MDISPDNEIIFQKSSAHQNPRQTLTITNNLSDGSVLAFKVKTTAPKQFVVRPNAGKLSPSEKTDITIVLQLRDGNIDTKRKDKFLVQSIRVPSETASLDENEFQSKIVELWATAEQNKKTAGDGPSDIILEKKIRCIYALDEGSSSQDGSTPSEPVSKSIKNANNGDSLGRRSVFEEAELLPLKTPESNTGTLSSPFTPITNTSVVLEKALKDLRDSKEKIVSLQSACDGYKQEIERLNMLRQRRADAAIPPTSTANVASATKSLKATASGVNFQALMILCFISFILGAWLF